MLIVPFNRDDAPVSTGWALLTLILTNAAILIWSQVHSSISAVAMTTDLFPPLLGSVPQSARCFSMLGGYI
jgi:hypothetical protein